jgi:hypothetical protein
LERLFATLRDNVRCVVLNACFSEDQARAIARSVGCAIGMSRAIADEAAITFAGGFYQALGFGRDVDTAFMLGCEQLGLESPESDDIPSLFTAPDVDAGSLFFVARAPRRPSPRSGDISQVP